MKNYIDEIAERIFIRAEQIPGLKDQDLCWENSRKSLYRIYVVLALSIGEKVTNKNVHDAWSAWQSGIMPEHPSIIPYDLLDRNKQDEDTLYTEAIREVAKELAHATT